MKTPKVVELLKTYPTILIGYCRKNKRHFYLFYGEHY